MLFRSAVCERLGDSAGAARATSDFQKWSEFGKRLKEAQRRVQETKGGALATLEVGQLYREAGMLEVASEWLQRSVDADHNTTASLAQADVLLELGRKDEAIALYRGILATDPDSEAAKSALRRATGEEPR